MNKYQKIRRIALLIATGFCFGVMQSGAVSQLNLRDSTVGGEILFLPMVVLLVWFGWMLRGEFRYIRRTRHNGCTRRK